MNSLEKKLEKIAAIHQASYTNQTKKYFGRHLSKTPVTKHLIEVPYRQTTIQIIYELGNHNLAQWQCKLPSKSILPSFTMETQSHFKRLFNKKNSIIQINSASPEFAIFLREKLDDLGLEQLARENRFEPIMSIQAEQNNSILVTEYHLEFPAKTEVIGPLVLLYKALVDY